MKKTISLTKGKGSIKHNNREFLTDNIDKDRVKDNIIYKSQKLEEAYDEIFSQALDQYNGKQKRADRKIDNYMTHLKNSKNNEKLFHEIIVQVGDKDDSGINSKDFEKCKSILDTYMKSFEKRNSHLHVFNATLHLDESTPHLHIDFIPVARDYKTGMSVRNSISKSMNDHYGEKNGNLKFYEVERQVIEQIANEFDIDIEKRNEHRADLRLPEYKKAKDELFVVEKDLNALKTAKNALKNELDVIKGVKIDKIKAEVQVFNKEKLTISKGEFEELKNIHEKALKVLAKEESLDTQKSSLEKRSKVLDERVVELDNRTKNLDRREEDMHLKEIQTNNLYNFQKNLNKKYEEQSHELGALGIENERLSNRISDLERENTILRKYVNELIKIGVVAYQISRDSKEVVKETFNRMIDSISPTLWFKVTDESGKDFCKGELNQTKKKIQEEKQKEKERERQKSYEADHGIDF